MLPPLDVNQEQLMSLKEAAKRYGLPEESIWRYVKYGSRGVYLAARMIGRRWFTSAEAFQRFCDQVTAVALADQPDSAVTKQSSVIRTSLPSAADQAAMAAALAASKRLSVLAFGGNAAILAKSRASRDDLVELHEFLLNWMPKPDHLPDDAYDNVRRGLFAHAVDILDGRRDQGRSLAAAKAWIESIDLATFDVRQLPGVGRKTETAWKGLIAKPKFAEEIRRPAGPAS